MWHVLVEVLGSSEDVHVNVRGIHARSSNDKAYAYTTAVPLAC
jgi:hypothetical protein